MVPDQGTLVLLSISDRGLACLTKARSDFEIQLQRKILYPGTSRSSRNVRVKELYEPLRPRVTYERSQLRSQFAARGNLAGSVLIAERTMRSWYAPAPRARLGRMILVCRWRKGSDAAPSTLDIQHRISQFLRLSIKGRGTLLSILNFFSLSRGR